MKPILEVNKISKKYRISHHSKSYLTLRDSFKDILRLSPPNREEFWALKDVTFDVHEGDCIGIIGRNGAGKSTLLKILSRITPPTGGFIKRRGRLASLLEVGTGFHPELTGRENVYLNGSILGMRKREIDSKFDEIVDFAGTEKFLDTPLKNYSSGMQLRLAFAVSAFLEPEIMLIDEVLAVGDAEFQKKCLGKMEDVTRSGRTILLVSHNLASVESLCGRALLLRDGTVQNIGPAASIIAEYMESIEAHSMNQSGIVDLSGNNPSGFGIQKIELLCDGRRSGAAYMGCQLEIRVHFRSERALDEPVLGLIFKDSQNNPLIGVNNKHYGKLGGERPVSEGYISMMIPNLTLFEGIYQADVHFGNGFHDLYVHRDCVTIHVEPKKFSNGEIPDKKFNRIFIRDVEWTMQAV